MKPNRRAAAAALVASLLIWIIIRSPSSEEEFSPRAAPLSPARLAIPTAHWKSDPLPDAPVPESRLPIPTPSVTRDAHVPAAKPLPGKSRLEDRLKNLSPAQRALLEKFQKLSVEEILASVAPDILRRQAWEEADIMRLALAMRGDSVVAAMRDAALTSEDWYLAELGVRVLGEMQGYDLFDDPAFRAEAKDVLMKAARGEVAKPEAAQLFALYALNDFPNDADLVTLYLGLCSSSDPNVADIAYGLLVSNLADKPADPTLRHLAAEGLEKGLYSSDDKQKLQAVIGLWKLLPSGEARDKLIGLYTSSNDPAVRSAVALAVGGSQTPELRALALDLLRQGGGDEYLHEALYHALDPADPSSHDLLTAALKGSALMQRVALVKLAQAKTPSPLLLQSVREALGSELPGVRLAALQALGSWNAGLEGDAAAAAWGEVTEILRRHEDQPEERRDSSWDPRRQMTYPLLESLYGLETTTLERLKVKALDALGGATRDPARVKEALRAAAQDPSAAIRRVAVVKGLEMGDPFMVALAAADFRRITKGPANYAYFWRCTPALKKIMGFDPQLNPRSTREEFDAAIGRIESWAREHASH